MEWDQEHFNLLKKFHPFYMEESVSFLVQDKNSKRVNWRGVGVGWCWGGAPPLVACWILVPQPGIECMCPTVEAESYPLDQCGPKELMLNVNQLCK